MNNRFKLSLIPTELTAYRPTGRTSQKIAIDLRFFSTEHLFNLAVKQFVDSKVSNQQQIPSTDKTTATIRVIIPFKDQTSANVVKKRHTDLSSEIKTTTKRVFISGKLDKDLKVREVKPALVNQQLMPNLCISVYNPCDAGLVGFSQGPAGT